MLGPRHTDHAVDCASGSVKENLIDLTVNEDAGFEMDLVTHDARKFFLMLLRKNGYVLEQLL
jgi:predicted nucleotidyltransferase